MSSKVNLILNRWRSQPDISDNVVDWRVLSQKPAEWADFPSSLDRQVIHALQSQGIEALYQHQVEAYQQVRDGKNLAIVTGTASGKSLCYILPMLDSLVQYPGGKALIIYPTKALAQDQLSKLRHLLGHLPDEARPTVNIYDGDTPQHIRPAVRQESAIILTNPDMLHTGILPHHTQWKTFFSAIKFIIIDEMHIYRGIFGSHVANLIRRLKRICRFYKSQPQYILTSATIGNPKTLAENLVEKPITIIDQDGSPHGERHFLLYNPPLIDQKLGIRQSSLLEGSNLAGELITQGIQTIVFNRTRRGVELTLTYLRENHLNKSPNQVRGYRSGYLPKERRAIEAGLRNGDVLGVVATSALELGIDIGAMDASVLIGYPGSIAATRQQAGRAGRKQSASLGVLIASGNAMDQYLARHPDYFFERSPEQALIAPNNLLILLQHIRCAAFELTFQPNEGFGAISSDRLTTFLELLANSGELHQQSEQFFWMSSQYPAAEISLRNASAEQVSLVLANDEQKRTVGQVDLSSAYWMVHPEAVYLHEGDAYLVDRLDLETGIAYLDQTDVDFYTQARMETQVEERQQIRQSQVPGAEKFLGEILVTNQVTGYRKIRWFTHENLGNGEVSLPPTHLNTIGYWIVLNENTLNLLKDQSQWTSDKNEYGPNWVKIRASVLNRDGDRCQVCGTSAQVSPLHVHHIQPFKTFSDLELANQLSNLTTLCAACHQRAEINVRIRSGMAGVSYLLHNLAPLLVMCDFEDLGSHYDPNSLLGGGLPTTILYDNIPGGLGLSESLYERHEELLLQGLETITQCPCEDGCPSCVGPVGEEGAGGKSEALAIFKALTHHD